MNLAGVFAAAAAFAPAVLAGDAIYNFSDGSRDIVCQSVGPGDKRTLHNRGGFVECDDLSTFGGPQDYPKAGLVPVVGKAFVFRSSNAADPIDSRRHPIAAGHAWHQGYLRCTSQKASMRCMSLLSGHGFFLSRDSQRAW
jgi:hypothetical protein